MSEEASKPPADLFSELFANPYCKAVPATLDTNMPNKILHAAKPSEVYMESSGPLPAAVSIEPLLIKRSFINQYVKWPQSPEAWLKTALALAGLALLLMLTVNSLRVANDEWAYSSTDQRQQSFEFYFEGGKRLFAGDYISDYHLDALLPSGYSWLYDAAGRVGDPFFFSKIVSLALMLSFVYIGFLIAKG